MNYIVTTRILWKHKDYPNKYAKEINHHSKSLNSSGLNPVDIYRNAVSEKKV